MKRKTHSRLQRRLNPMLASVRRTLTKKGLVERYRELPQYQQNDYPGWIGRAKLAAAKVKRLHQMLDELQGGRLYMNMTGKPRGKRA